MQRTTLLTGLVVLLTACGGVADPAVDSDPLAPLSGAVSTPPPSAAPMDSSPSGASTSGEAVVSDPATGVNPQPSPPPAAADSVPTAIAEPLTPTPTAPPSAAPLPSSPEPDAVVIEPEVAVELNDADCPPAAPSAGQTCPMSVSCLYEGDVICDCAPGQLGFRNVWQCDGATTPATDPVATGPTPVDPVPSPPAPDPAPTAPAPEPVPVEPVPPPEVDLFSAAWDIISARCVSCHAQRRPILAADEASYSARTKQQIASEINRNAMPPGGGLSDAEKQAILDWTNAP